MGTVLVAAAVFGEMWSNRRRKTRKEERRREKRVAVAQDAAFKKDLTEFQVGRIFGLPSKVQLLNCEY